jgi:hypothetical protein
MPNTPIATQAAAGPYVSTPVGAGSLDLTWTAADTGNGNLFAVDLPLSIRPEGTIGGDILLMWNTDAAPHTVTISSVVDDKMRTGDITAYSIGAGVISAFNFSQIVGWANNSSQVLFLANSNLVKFAIVKR